MAWVYKRRTISKEDYEAIKRGEKKEEDFFDECALIGYGAIPQCAREDNGEYYIPYGISTCCD